MNLADEEEALSFPLAVMKGLESLRDQMDPNDVPFQPCFWKVCCEVYQKALRKYPRHEWAYLIIGSRFHKDGDEWQELGLVRERDDALKIANKFPGEVAIVGPIALNLDAELESHR